MIYQLNQMMENLLSTLMDKETGEMLCSEEEMNEAIAGCEMEFDEKILALRNSYLETQLSAKRVAAEAQLLRDEAYNVQKRANTLQKRADRIKRFIAWLLNGDKFEKEGAKISYRSTKECVLDDDFVEWAKKNRPEYLNFEPRKLDVKMALLNGAQIEHAHIETKEAIQIK